MLEYIERGKALKEWPLCDEPADAYQYIKNIPSADVVSRDAFNRLLAENDIMRTQLAQIGKKLGDSMADVRPVRRGHWVKRMEEHTAVEYTSFTPIWSCSECALEYDPALAQRIHFCYNCSADMREAHDGI